MLSVVVDLIGTFEASIYAEDIVGIVSGVERSTFFESFANRSVECVDFDGSALKDHNVAVLDLRSVFVVQDFSGQGDLVAYVECFMSGEVAPIALQGFL